MDAVTDVPEPLQDLVAHAHETRVVVIGGGIAGLVSAWECAKVGMSVTLVEASVRLGGVIGSAEVAGIDLETGVTCWSTRNGAVRRLIDEVMPDAAVVTPRDDHEWIVGSGKGAAAPLPENSVLGIPANTWDENARRLIGWSGTWRAYLDRLRPPLTIGTQRSLGALVRGRMGEQVRDRLVAPITVDRFGLDPDAVDVEVAAPGISSALTRTGSLGGAVAELRVDATGPSIEGLEGGMPRLVDALRERLAERGVDIRVGAPVTQLVRDEEGWTLDDDLVADAVIIATDEVPARALLGQALDDPGLAATTPAGIAREVVTLVVDAPELDAAPRGTQIHAVPGALRATGLVHETARWDWLARRAGPGRHVLRVAFGGPAEPPATAGRDDADAAAMAVAEASALLGVPLDEHRIAGARRDVYTLVPPASVIGGADRAARMRAAVARAEGLAVVGAWVAGSGLAQVVADAQEQADRLRRRALWGAENA
jgi:oxygen-dependent protoporphyrinogen oxidase